ncbi:hypothetical protein [Streptomyces alfalfae]
MNEAQIIELGRALRLLGEHGETLGRDTPTEKITEIRNDLKRALLIVEQAAGPKPYTDCKEHPFGAIDEDAPDRCLLCQTRRRRGELARQANDRGMPGAPERRY